MCCVVYGAKGVRVKGRAECKEEEGRGRERVRECAREENEG